jgi:excisionase family DNA binding protein
MTPAEVAALFRVSVSTVARWVTEGKLQAVQTPSGRRRFRFADVEALTHGAHHPTLSSSVTLSGLPLHLAHNLAYSTVVSLGARVDTKHPLSLRNETSNNARRTTAAKTYSLRPSC